jgi:precorrin-6B methylase 1
VAQPALTVVGTGIQIGRDMTPAAKWSIQHADKVLFLVADAVAARTVCELNPNGESLHGLYDVDKPRMQTYREMVDRILWFVRGGYKVCVVAYGHPGVFAYPMHEAIRYAQLEGYSATMLPAVSSVDCLIADLAVDPGTRGMQIFDASHFLFHTRSFDPTVALVLLQVGITGDPGYKIEYGREGLRLLVELLVGYYGGDHEAVLYEAPEYPMSEPLVQRISVAEVADADVRAGSTLYVPPKGKVELNNEMVRRLEAALAETRAKQSRMRGAAISGSA